MSAAGLVLAINLFLAGLFAAAFAMVAAYEKTALRGRWLALAYGLFLLNAALEFVQPTLVNPQPIGFIVFFVSLLAMLASGIGLACHYGLPAPKRPMAAIALVSTLGYLALAGMPREAFARTVLYQSPYIAAQLLIVCIIIGSRRRAPIDIALAILSGLSAVQFAAKPLLAASVGLGGGPESYLHSVYAAYSQTLEAFLLVSTGLLLLLAIIQTIMADMTTRSETDKLSGLLNRRGFEDRSERPIAMAARAGLPSVMVVADLDHFKHINDSFGHETGDKVIAAFARELATLPAQGAIVGRLGGEEFAIFLPGANVAAGRQFAERARTGFAERAIEGIDAQTPVTASFGVAELQQGDGLSDLLRRADAALYQAKKSGRNRVCVAHQLSLIDNTAEGDRRCGSRRR